MPKNKTVESTAPLQGECALWGFPDKAPKVARSKVLKKVRGEQRNDRGPNHTDLGRLRASANASIARTAKALCCTGSREAATTGHVSLKSERSPPVSLSVSHDPPSAVQTSSPRAPSPFLSSPALAKLSPDGIAQARQIAGTSRDKQQKNRVYTQG